MKSDFEDTFECPVCGAEVAVGRLSCPECGADERTGWGDSGDEDGLDLMHEDDFDYQSFLRNEGLEKGNLRPEGLNRGWWILAIVVLIGFLVWVFGG